MDVFNNHCVFPADIPGTGKTINITPLSQMQNPAFARQMTGGSELSDEHKKQIQDQQKVGGGGHL